MRKIDFSPAATWFLKGLAITSIALHNFSHWLPFAIGENEFDFNRGRILALGELVSGDVAIIPKALFDYFGFLPITTFLFVSGYGLAKSFDRRRPPAAGPFVLEKLRSLYALLFIAFGFALAAHTAGIFPWLWADFAKHALKYLTISHNFSRADLLDFCGPWWFFNLMMQLYLLFPLVFFPLKKYGGKALAAILAAAYALIYGLAPLAEAHEFPIFGNFLGHLPEFALGIYLGLAPAKTISRPLAAAAGLTFALGNYYEAFFPLTFLTFVVATTPLFLALERACPQPMRRAMVFLGVLSPIIFVTNGPLRQVLFETAWAAPSLGGQYLYAALHLVLVVLVSWLIHLAVENVKTAWPALAPGPPAAKEKAAARAAKISIEEKGFEEKNLEGEEA